MPGLDKDYEYILSMGLSIQTKQLCAPKFRQEEVRFS